VVHKNLQPSGEVLKGVRQGRLESYIRWHGKLGLQRGETNRSAVRRGPTRQQGRQTSYGTCHSDYRTYLSIDAICAQNPKM